VGLDLRHQVIGIEPAASGLIALGVNVNPRRERLLAAL